jgi:hypothetical protein
MDVYSCGVMLFTMLVGRKPWDAEDSRSLQYAVQRAADAPGFRDRRFVALSADARGLLRWMLADLARERPGAAEVLAHPWLRRGPAGGGARAARRLGRAVQRRMTALADSRRLLGTRRALMLLHGGAPGAAEAFHLAVREAARLREEAERRTAAAAAAGAGVAASRGPIALPAAGPPAAVATAGSSERAPGGSGTSFKRPAPSRDSSTPGGAAAGGGSPAHPATAAPAAAAAVAGEAGPPRPHIASASSSGGGAAAGAQASAMAPAAAGSGDSPPRRKRRKGAQVSALAAAIVSASERPMAELAASKDASLADLARVSLARRSLVGGGAEPQGGWGGGAFGAPDISAVAAANADRPAGQENISAAAAEGDAGGGALLLPGPLLERGISMPAELAPLKRGGGGRSLGRQERWPRWEAMERV